MYRPLIPLLLSSLLGLGCGTPSPEKLCKTLDKLQARSKAGKKKSAADRKKERARCVKDMTSLKKKKPKAYKCVAKCSKQSDYDSAMLCTVGCVMKHTSKKEMANAKGRTQKEMDAACKTDWGGRALHPVSDRVDGVGFSLKIPNKGLKRDAKPAEGGFPGYVTWQETGGMCGPGFTVQIDPFPPSSLDGISTIMPKKKILLKKAVPGGFLVVTGEEGNEYLNVAITRKSKSGKSLKLSMSQRSEKLPQVFAKQQAWLQKVAGTFEVK